MLTLAAWRRGKSFARYKHYLLQYLIQNNKQKADIHKEMRKCDLSLWGKESQKSQIQI